MAFTIIDGNIKQQMLPFLLDPSSALNLDANKKGEKDAYRNSSPQYFTFRNNNKLTTSGKGIINFCPKTMKNYFDQDISYRLTYKYKGLNPNSKESVTFDSILDNIPGILIREYLPDTALEQSINFFISLIKGVMSLFSDKGISVEKPKPDKDKPETNLSDEAWYDGLFKKLWNVTWFLMKYVTGTGVEETESMKVVTGTDAKGNTTYGFGLPAAASSGYTSFTSSFASSPHYAQILKFPHMIYYRLQSCTTTGIYELPCIKQDKKLYSSNGAAGWEADENSGMRFLPKSLKSLPGVGPLIGKMFGNIGVSWTPWWDAEKGNATPEPDVVITFDLFNDTNEAALYNFIFVNTLVPNNKWIQYGLFLHSSHIYDIKLEGYNRLFACSGQFEVAYDGVLRDPPPNWLDQTGPLAQHLNLNIDKAAFFESVKNNKTIKIPDIYKVTLTFSSLLPANFNNYLYTLVANDNHIDTYKTKTRDDSQLADAMVNAFSGLLTGAKAAFTSDQGYVPTDLRIK